MAAVRILFLVALMAYASIIPTGAQDSTENSSSEPSTDRTFSIESTNAPDVQYNWDAVSCLTQAYIMYPDDLDAVVQNFGELFKIKHKGIWNVGVGCSSLYIPKTNVVIVVKVTEGSKQTLFNLYN